MSPRLSRQLRIGDLVREHDGCHEGVVVFIDGYETESGVKPLLVRVRWRANGWRTDFRPDELTLIEARKEYLKPVAERPRTEVESPRQQLDRWLTNRRAK